MKDGYKSTPIGDLPENWGITRLGEISERITKGTTPTTVGYAFLKEGINFVKIESILSNGVFKKDSFAFISEECQNALQRSQLKENDILFSIAGAIGRTAIVNKSILPANTNQAVAIIRLRTVENIGFIYHFLRGDYIKSYINKINVQTAQANLSLSDLQRLIIPFPPIEEQQKIAVILTSLDEKNNLIHAQITEHQNLKIGLLQELLTKGIGHSDFQNSEIGEIPQSWSLKRVVDFAKVTTGAKDTQNKVDDGKYPFVVRSQKLEKINTYSFDGEAVLTAGDGVGVGKVFHYLNCKFDYHQRVYNIHGFTKEVLGKYFFEYFKNKFIMQVRKYNAKGSVDSVRMEMITKMYVAIPPIEEQKKIVSILSALDNKIHVLQSKKVIYEDLKRGLMQQLLTGKMRLNIHQQQDAVA